MTAPDPVSSSSTVVVPFHPAAPGASATPDLAKLNLEPLPTAGRLLVILTLLNILNFADRYVMVAFSTTIVPELGMTNLQFGLLTGFVFLTIYMVVGLVAGSLADRVHRPRLIATGLLLWSAMTAVSGLAKSFGQMAAARMLIGVGEATLTPTAASLLGDAYPPARRALPFGLFYWGIPVGIGGAYIFAAVAGPTLGWRGSFMLLGAVGAVFAAALLLVREIPRGRFDDPAVKAAVAQSPPQSVAASFGAVKALLRDNSAFALMLAGGCATTFVQGSSVLDLLWWVKERGYVEGTAQSYTGLMFLFGGVLGAVLGGVGGDVARRRAPGGDIRFLAWVFFLTIPMVIAYRFVAPATPVFYLLGFGNCMLFMLYFGPIYSALQEQVPAPLRGTATGVVVVLTTFTSAMGAALVGYLADAFADAGRAQPITEAIRLCQVVGMIAIPCFFAASAIVRERAEQQAVPAPA